MTDSAHTLQLDGERLLQIARDTGLRHHLHGVAPKAAGELLVRFVLGVQAASALDPHPPHRDCMCANCRPSFGPDHGDGVNAAMRLVESYVYTCVRYAKGERQATEMQAARDALTAHLSTIGGANG